MPISLFSGIVRSDEPGRRLQGWWAWGFRHPSHPPSAFQRWTGITTRCTCTTAALSSSCARTLTRQTPFAPRSSTGSWTRYGAPLAPAHPPPLCRDGWCGPGMMAVGRYLTVLVTCWFGGKSTLGAEKAMAPHSSPLTWKIPWMEEPGGLQSMRSLGVGHDWVTSLSLFTFMHWSRKWQPTPVFLPEESQGRGSLVGCPLWGRTESDTTEAT